MEGPGTQRGELWRLFTSIFLHTDILHLLFNLYWFWMFGTLLERAFGHAKTALIVIFLAVGSGAFQFAIDRGGVGLSGVGYGLFGMLWVLSKYDGRFRGIVGPNITTLFVVWFFLCVATTITKIYSVGNVATLQEPFWGRRSATQVLIRKSDLLRARP
jgi:GlpG protein